MKSSSPPPRCLAHPRPGSRLGTVSLSAQASEPRNCKSTAPPPGTCRCRRAPGHRPWPVPQGDPSPGAVRCSATCVTPPSLARREGTSAESSSSTSTEQTLVVASTTRVNNVRPRSETSPGALRPYGTGPKRDAVMEAVRSDWAAYNVTITDVRPGSAATTR